MQALLRGWRRKLGVVLLVLVIVSASAWARSYRFADLVWMQGAKHSSLIYSSSGGFNVWLRSDREFREPYGWIVHRLNHHERGSQFQYWLLTIPLVCTSTYLLMGGKSIQPEAANE